MAYGISESEQHLGKLVVLEGHTETISTQLRLLPPSSKVLVVPSILEHLPSLSEESIFDPRTFIREVHTANSKRTELARSFLRHSTPAHPRLVFMNGGGIGAQVTCITKIREKTTNGKLREAEIVFNNIVKDGVSGLQSEDELQPEKLRKKDAWKESNEEGGKEEDKNPCVIAMRAADSLDRATAALQMAEEVSEGIDPEPTIAVQKHLEDPNEVQQPVPDTGGNAFTSANGGTIVRSVITLPDRDKQKPFVPRLRHPKHLSVMSHMSVKGEHADGRRSPSSHSILSSISAPTTPQDVEFGEACLVDVQSASPTEKTVKRVASVDRFSPSNSRFQELEINPLSLRHYFSANSLDVRPTSLDGRTRRSWNSDFGALPKTSFLRASELTIRRNPTLRHSLRSGFASSATRVFVDRGSDAFWIEETTGIPKNAEAAVIEPLFAISEDLIIYVSNGSYNEVFESVIGSSMNGGDLTSSSPSTTSDSSHSTTSAGSETDDTEFTRPYSRTTVETDDATHAGRYDFDSCRASLVFDGVFLHSPKHFWPPDLKLGPISSGAHAVWPQTHGIAQRPSELSAKLQDFQDDSGNAVDIQNSLRSFLKSYLPTGENLYSQYYYPMTSEADRFWKPVFRMDDAIGIAGRTVDQILALGCDKGVNGEFFAEMAGHIEKLGAKRSGVSRSGRVDLSYLIATAMQSYAIHPSRPQKIIDPLSDVYLLATMIIPHLEAYLVNNTTTRFLVLHYSPAQLPIILTLRDLIGSSLFKVAGVLDGNSSDPPSHTRKCQVTPTSNVQLSQSTGSRQTTRSRPNTLRGGAKTSVSRPEILPSTTYIKHTKSVSSASFSKADFLLPSTATDEEITEFLSSIWKSLIETDTFYNPEPEPRIVSKASPTPTTANTASKLRSKILPSKTAHLSSNPHLSSHHSREYETVTKTQFKSNKSSRGEKDLHGRPARLQPPKDDSYASSIRTTASTRERQSEQDWANFYIGEEDSEDDAYDRMVLGRAGLNPGEMVYGKQYGVTGRSGDSSTRKLGNSRKALKWLGLA